MVGAVLSNAIVEILMPLNWDEMKPISELAFELFNEILPSCWDFAAGMPSITGLIVAVIVAIVSN